MMETRLIDKLLSDIIISKCRNKCVRRMKMDLDLCSKVITESTKLFSQEPLLLEIRGNFIVVGDIHGNVEDLLRIFTKFGYPPKTNYVFLGDYVDRGDSSLEVILTLCCLKLRQPQNIYLIRGNHESESMTTNYGFRTECRARANNRIYNQFLDMFKELPCAILLNQTVFCVHGGISKDLKSIDQLRNRKKPGRAIPNSGIICDMLWSDPCDSVDTFIESDRNVGYIFGAKPLASFCSDNDIELVVRSHESCQDGFRWLFEDNQAARGKLLTIFSSSNYIGEDNKSAVLYVPANGDKSFKIHQFLPINKNDKVKFTLPEWININYNVQEIDNNIPEIPTEPLLALEVL